MNSQTEVPTSEFPTVRRGYDPATVEARIAALENEIAALRDELAHKPTMAESASERVQSIISAAETSAMNITDEASEQARTTKLKSEQDAERTREQAEQQATDRVGEVTEAADHLQSSSERLQSSLEAQLDDTRVSLARLVEEIDLIRANVVQEAEAALGKNRLTGTGMRFRSSEMRQAMTDAPADEDPQDSFDALLLVATKMARDGSTREETGRYLIETFDVDDPTGIIEEAYSTPA